MRAKWIFGVVFVLLASLFPIITIPAAAQDQKFSLVSYDLSGVLTKPTPNLLEKLKGQRVADYYCGQYRNGNQVRCANGQRCCFNNRSGDNYCCHGNSRCGTDGYCY
jgi:hypothetical protein